jgi:hypothetical protein
VKELQRMRMEILFLADGLWPHSKASSAEPEEPPGSSFSSSETP